MCGCRVGGWCGGSGVGRGWGRREVGLGKAGKDKEGRWVKRLGVWERRNRNAGGAGQGREEGRWVVRGRQEVRAGHPMDPSSMAELTHAAETTLDLKTSCYLSRMFHQALLSKDNIVHPQADTNNTTCSSPQADT